ncbi:MAG: hypothetical protein CME06_00590 [Gemmatimonadetes bacterium]|nr:hypothetical protein [Gemmatimonadota bacterium]
MAADPWTIDRNDEGCSDPPRLRRRGAGERDGDGVSLTMRFEQLLEHDAAGTLADRVGREWTEAEPAFYAEVAEASLLAAESVQQLARGIGGCWPGVPEPIRAVIDSDPDLSFPENDSPAEGAELYDAMMHWEALQRIEELLFAHLARSIARASDWRSELLARALPSFGGADPPTAELVAALALADPLARQHSERPLELVEWVLRCKPKPFIAHNARLLFAYIGLLQGLPGDLEEIRASVVRRAHRGRERARAYLAFGQRVMSTRGPVYAMRFVRRAIVEASTVRDRRTVGHAAQLLAHLSGIAGNYPDAIELFSVALALHREIGDRRMEGMTLGGLATFTDEQGDPKGTREKLERALAIHREVFNRRSEATALCNLAIMNQRMGDSTRTRELLEDAVEICREIGDRWTEGTTLLNLAVNLHHAGRFSRARELFDSALAIQREVGHRRFEGVTLQNLAKLHHQTGAPERASSLFEDALAIFREVGDRTSEAKTLHELADLLRDEGKNGLALELLEQAHDIHRSVGNAVGEARSLTSLAKLRQGLGDTRRARALFRRALGIYRKIGNPRGEGTVLGDWSSLELALGRSRRAAVMARRACACLEQVGDAVALVDSQHIYARASQEIGDLDEAERQYRRAVDGVEDWLRDIGADARRSRVLDRSLPLFRDAVTFLFGHAGDPRAAFEMAERAKARSLLELVRNKQRIEAVPISVAEKRTGLELHLRTLQDALIEERSSPSPRAGMVVYLEAELERVRREHGRLLDDLAHSDPGYAVEEGLVKPLDLPRVQERVVAAEDVALLEYFVAGDAVHLWIVLRREMHTITLDCGIDELRELLQKTIDPMGNDPPRLLRLLPRDLRRLGRWVLDPALPHLRAVRRLLIVPSGPLHRLPFEMLVLRMPGEENWSEGAGIDRFAAPEYAADRFEIAYGPSATLLDPALGSAPKEERRTPAVLALGDPLYEQFAGTGSEDSMVRLPRLPGTADELRHIQKSFPQSRVFLREQARESVYRCHAPEADIIHLGCHGLVDGDDPSYAGVVLSAGEGSAEDAWLQSYEIAEIGLTRGPLVVISACHVAAGRLSGAEGLLGLSRAFIQAGARIVVASIWSVEDRVTVHLIDRFYRALATEGCDATRALATARREHLEAERRNPRLDRAAPGSHPYFWAGFRVFGR